MTTADWITVAVAIVGGVLAGVIGSRIVHRIVGAPSRPSALPSTTWIVPVGIAPPPPSPVAAVG